MLSRGAVRETLIALAGVALAAFLLLKLGGLLDSGWAGAWDRALLLGARGLVSSGPLVAITALGSGTVLTLSVIVAGGALLIAGAGRAAVLLAAAAAGGGLAVDALKALVARVRPALLDHLVEVGSPSFPSGHSANSAIVYLLIGALIARHARSRALGRYALACAALLVLAIGASRVMLSVHWPSDVLAGWLFGAVWVWAWLRLAPRRAA